MTSISLKLPEELVSESDRFAASLGLRRSAYIRQAIEVMNESNRSALEARQMANASQLVRDESMEINREFAAIEGDPET